MACHVDLEIENAFGRLALLVNRSSELLITIPESLSPGIPTNAAERIPLHRLRVSLIRDVINRRRLKVVFFGRTSSGKSSVINCLLGEKVLPTGLGHTTCHFVNIQGTAGDDPILLVRSQDDQLSEFNFRSLSDLVNALGPENIQAGPTSSVELFWPRHRCRILQDDVILLDSPGVDVDTDFDQWIERDCLDADLFVMVVNAESTIMMREKDFFFKVAQKIAKPNVIILFNRWDCSSDEEESLIDAVRDQHMTRASEFLISELKISKIEAKQRIFFVSAKDVLEEMTYKSTMSRETLAEWRRFESFLMSQHDCLSSTLIRFQPHIQAGLEICSELESTQISLHQICLEKLDEISKQRSDSKQQLEKLKLDMTDLTARLKADIGDLQDSIEKVVSNGIRDEIETIQQIVFDFDDMKFIHDLSIIQVYTQQVIRFVEKSLEQSLRFRLSHPVNAQIESSKCHALQMIADILPQAKRDRLTAVMEMQHSEIDFSLNLLCHSAQFQPDMEFRFSLAPSQVLSFTKLWILKLKCWLKQAEAKENEKDLDNDKESLVEVNRLNNLEYLSSSGFAKTFLKIIVATYLTSETSTALACTGLVVKSMAGRAGLIFAMSSLLAYSSVYFVERILWRISTQERHFKQQLVTFTTSKLAEMEKIMVSSIRQQVHRELATLLRLACGIVEDAGQEFSDNLDKLSDELEHLSEIQEKCQDLLESSERVRMALQNLVHQQTDY